MLGRVCVSVDSLEWFWSLDELVRVGFSDYTSGHLVYLLLIISVTQDTIEDMS